MKKLKSIPISDLLKEYDSMALSAIIAYHHEYEPSTVGFALLELERRKYTLSTKQKDYRQAYLQQYHITNIFEFVRKHSGKVDVSNYEELYDATIKESTQKNYQSERNDKTGSNSIFIKFIAGIICVVIVGAVILKSVTRVDDVTNIPTVDNVQNTGKESESPISSTDGNNSTNKLGMSEGKQSQQVVSNSNYATSNNTNKTDEVLLTLKSNAQDVSWHMYKEISDLENTLSLDYDDVQKMCNCANKYIYSFNSILIEASNLEEDPQNTLNSNQRNIQNVLRNSIENDIRYANNKMYGMKDAYKFKMETQN